jgi:uncharacterized caspase-like protein
MLRVRENDRKLGRGIRAYGPVLLGLLLALGGSIARPATAEPSAEAPAGRKWALLVGIEKYQKANQLIYTVNDVRRIVETLTERGDYDADNILEVVDTATDAPHQPLRASLLAAIPAFLQKPGPNDYVLVYFSGHGFLDKKDGKAYLAPIDCDPANAAATGISVEWFREQLAKCKAHYKLLVLDACHAGSEKGDDDNNSVASKDLGTPFQDLEGVVTLASSTSAEHSLIWEEKQQSLFSFWFNQGLRGLADVNGDGDVTIDELYDYVYRNVVQTAKMRFPKAQTPVRIVRVGTHGVPVVIHLKPQKLKDVITDMAEQLAWNMETRKIPKVGVLEFTNDSKIGEVLGIDFGLLGRYCAEEMEKRLSSLGTGKFSLVDRRRLQAAIKAKGFGVKDLASDEALKDLSTRAGGLPVIAVGTLRNRLGHIMGIECKLIQTDRDDLAGSASETAALNESEWAMLGHSAQVRPEDRKPVVSHDNTPPPSQDAVVIARLDRRAAGPHPLLDPNFPYRVKIMVNEQPGQLPVERKPVFRGNDMYVGLRQGEVFEIWVENHSDRKVYMRLLVDGLNTRPERPEKMMVVEERTSPANPAPAQSQPNGPAGWAMAMRVNLDDANPWILDAPDDKNPDGTCAVRGFFSTPDADAKYREFKVVDRQDSLAARQDFTDQIGLITAVFYNFKGAARGIGIGAGKEGTNRVDLVKDAPEVGNMLAVVNIHYVEPEALEKQQ